MSRIHILAVMSWTASALTPVDVRGEERPATPPIRIAARLFDHEQKTSLGLSTVKGQHQVLFRATPDSYKFCHQQNLAVWKGKLFLMWSNGITHEDHNGQRILYCHTPDGVKWSQPAVLTEDHDGPGPLACVSAGWHDAGDTLVAYYTAIVEKRPGIDERNAMFYIKSRDGRTWSKPTRLARGFFIEGPRRLPGGRLLMNGQWADRQPRLRFTDSSNGVDGWKDGKVPRVENVLTFPEPSWFVRADGTIVMIFRTKSGDRWIYASVSKDNGESWTRPVQTNFPDATARAFAGNLPDGTAFIISNPSRVPSKTYPIIGRRNPLTIALSDDGVLFDRAFVIRSADTSMRFKGINKLDGWQYPTAVTWKDHLHVAYSINKEDEGVTRIALSDLRAVADDQRIDSRIDRRNGDQAVHFRSDRDTGPAFLEHKAWTPVVVEQLNGKAPRLKTAAGIQVISKPWDLGAVYYPYLIYLPDRNRLLMQLMWGQEIRTGITTSDDGGSTWSRPRRIGNGWSSGLTFLDGDRAVLKRDNRYWFTADSGASWNRSLPAPPCRDRKPFHEDSPFFVDHDATSGRATRLWSTGKKPGLACLLRTSDDDGRTWSPCRHIPQWGRTGEIVLHRARNGNLVAACRVNLPQFEGKIDHFSGLGVSVSRDNGRTWSRLNILYAWGRHMSSMVTLANGDIVLTYTVREGYVDTADGFPQFGIEALISRDHGLTWDLDHRFLLAVWRGNRKSREANSWFSSPQRTTTVLLPDKSLVTAFGTGYRNKGRQGKRTHSPQDIAIVRWRVGAGKPGNAHPIADAPFDSELRNVFDPRISGYALSDPDTD